MGRICESALSLLSNCLLEDASNCESQIFHLKMTADYNRYIAEFSHGEVRLHASVRAQKAFEQVQKLVQESLPAAHPIRLGMSLSWAVWQHEVEGNTEVAIKMASTAFDAAMEELDALSEES